MRSHCHCSSPLKVSGIIFALIALMHIIRIIMGWPVNFNEMPVGIWPSIIIAAVSTVMAIWDFKACHYCSCHKNDACCHHKDKTCVEHKHKTDV